MPEESKKNQHKTKNDPKDQRKRRQGRQPANPVEKKPEKQPERTGDKQFKEPAKPAYEPPGPEFYKNLKRETDEILKITEEANTKYKKKEIKSNWAKYEMPVESYEEIDEHENIGADYGKLIQAPATAGGHFQFKHEKSWDTNTEPSLYDKYFDINMDLLFLAVSTIPFYERNSIEQSMFNEKDIATMNHRAAKFKHKYYNDKKYSTPEIEAQDKILKSLSCNIEDSEAKANKFKTDDDINDNALSKDTLSNFENFSLDTNLEPKKDDITKDKSMPLSSPLCDNKINLRKMEEINFSQDEAKTEFTLNETEILFNNENIIEELEVNTKPVPMKVEPSTETKRNDEIKDNKQKSTPNDTPKNPVIESPEDLEKWLDDFLDG